MDDEKAGPIPVAEYSRLPMHSTQGRCYGVGEIRDLLTDLRFDAVTFTPTAAGRGVMTARRQ